MGLIKAAMDAVGGNLADQWLDVVGPGPMDDSTLAVVGVMQGQNNGRGENTKGSVDYISNGSKIRVPENTALILADQGKIHDVVLEPGGYTVNNDAPSLFAGDGFFKTLITESWNRFKFGGQPSQQMIAYFINLREIRGLMFGTPGPITYKDFSLAPAGSDRAPVLRLIARGRYSIKIADPVLFFKNFLPPNMIESCSASDEAVTAQLFSEFITTFNASLNGLSKTVEISDLPAHGPELAKAMGDEAGPEGSWLTRFGIEIVSVGVEAVEYDEESKKLMDQLNAGLMMQGSVGNAYAQTTVANAALAAGENGGAGSVMGVGMGVGAIGGTMAGLQQPVAPPPAETPVTTTEATVSEDPQATLQQLKSLLDQGLITQEQFAAKQQEVLARM